ncbi:hypothetical protein FQR65_LT13417 [Abscondita terminalis]|nr:hypothetical protein FQR65_LT13417 [Abscondita terminalis]
MGTYYEPPIRKSDSLTLAKDKLVDKVRNVVRISGEALPRRKRKHSDPKSCDVVVEVTNFSKDTMLKNEDVMWLKVNSEPWNEQKAMPENQVFNTKLVEAVEKHPCLYHYNLKEYSNRNKVQAAWETIAQEMESTAKDCKEVWRNLRIVYIRNLKKPPSGSATKKKEYHLLKYMQFLNRYVNSKTEKGLPGKLPSPPQTDNAYSEPDQERVPETIDNNKEANDASDTKLTRDTKNIRSSKQASVAPSNKRKKTPTDADAVVINYIKSNTQKGSNHDNPRTQFLLSLVPDVEDMTSTQYRTFRNEVCSLIDRIIASAPSPLHSSNSTHSAWSSASTPVLPQTSAQSTPTWEYSSTPVYALRTTDDVSDNPAYEEFHRLI